MLFRCFFKLSKVFVLFVISVTASFSKSQEIGDISALCQNITPQNRAIAESAGYNLDEICGSSKSSVNVISRTVPPPTPLRKRSTVSSGNSTSQNPSRPFGYDLFANYPETFAPNSNVPVSDDYILGLGDTLDILFYGKKNDALSLEINREGLVDFPQLGPIALAGLTFGEAKKKLQAQMSSKFIGTQASISLANLNSIQIFILGEAFIPGAYTISSLSNITNALIAGGGVSDIGSLRNIQLKRNNQVIATLDLYDLLLFGDTKDDKRVEAGDVIYIPTIQKTATIQGQVLRPATYELKGGETLEEIISLAGGPGVKAFLRNIKLKRISADGFTTVFDLDFADESDRSFILSSGDQIVVGQITEFDKEIVTLSGAVRFPGMISLEPSMRISDVFPNHKKFSPDADLNDLLLIREIPNTSDLKVILLNLKNIFEDKTTSDNLLLQSRDELFVLSKYSNRANQMAPYVQNLTRQSRFGRLPKTISVEGAIRFPGTYPLTQNMTLSDLIKFAGGLTDRAYGKFAEITRLDISDTEEAKSEIITADLSKASTVLLHESDSIVFRTIPGFNETNTITLEGEFVFPGTYTFQRNEKLSSIIRRAGGLTEDAYTEGAKFLRQSLKEREKQEIDRLVRELQQVYEQNLLKQANSQISDEDGARFAMQSKIIDDLSLFEPTGRMVISLKEILLSTSDDISLQDGDVVILPKYSQEVTVLGEVKRPLSLTFDSKFNLNDYIMKAGGLNKTADRKSVYVVKASGQVVSPRRNLFKFGFLKSEIGPGDTIVVPLNTDYGRLRSLAVFSEASQVIYQLSLGAAALRSFND